MDIRDPRKEEPAQKQYTYVNGIGFLPENNEQEKLHLSHLYSELCWTLLFTILLKHFLLLPSYYLSGMLGADVRQNPMTGLITMTPLAMQRAQLILYLVSTLLPLGILWFTHSKECASWRLLSPPSFRYAFNSFFLLCGTGVTSFFVADYFTAFLSKMGLVFRTVDYALPSNAYALLLYCLTAVVLPSLLDELFYRGLLLQLLLKYDDTFAVLVSAFLYAIMQPSAYGVIFSFFFGMALSYIAIKHGGLLVCMAASFTIRSLQVLRALMANGMLGNRTEFLPNLLLLAILFAGLACFIVRLKRNPHAFEMRKDSSNLTNRKKLRQLAWNPFFWTLIVVCTYRIFTDLQFIN